MLSYPDAIDGWPGVFLASNPCPISISRAGGGEGGKIRLGWRSPKATAFTLLKTRTDSEPLLRVPLLSHALTTMGLLSRPHTRLCTCLLHTASTTGGLDSICHF